MLEEDCAVDQSVSVSESPENERDRRLQRSFCTSTIRVDLRLAVASRGQAIEASLNIMKCYKERQGKKVSARPI